MKLLITGSFGLIGSRLTNLLQQLGHEVVGIDIGRNYLKFNNLNNKNNNYQNYEQYRTDLISPAKIYGIDVKNGFEILDLIKKENPDVIIHLAALPLANLSFNVSQEAYTSIFGSTFNLMESIRILGSKTKIVFASSSMVYGNFKNNQAFEDDKLEPISNYGAAKLAGEVLVRGFSKSHQISSIIIRPSAVYGPGDMNARVLQKFIDAGFNNEIANVSGRELVLDFTYIDDICKGFIKAAEKLFNTDEVYFDIFNCTSGDPVSLDYAVNSVKEFFPDMKINFAEKDSRVPKRGGLNLEKAKNILGYKPSYDFKKGLSEYVRIEKKLRKS